MRSYSLRNFLRIHLAWKNPNKDKGDIIPKMKAIAPDGLQEGLIEEDHVVGSIGEVLLGKAPARETADEITLFDALGLAVEDVMCGKFLCK